MPETNDSPLIQALAKRKGSAPSDNMEELLKMILEQVTKMADSLDADDDNAEKVVTQESHVP